MIKFFNKLEEFVLDVVMFRRNAKVLRELEDYLDDSIYLFDTKCDKSKTEEETEDETIEAINNRVALEMYRMRHMTRKRWAV